MNSRQEKTIKQLGQVVDLLLQHHNLQVIMKPCENEMCTAGRFPDGDDCPDCHGLSSVIRLENRPIRFTTHKVHKVPGRGEVHLVRWPEGVRSEWVTNHEIILDGKKRFCCGIECMGELKPKLLVGLVLRGEELL